MQAMLPSQWIIQRPGHMMTCAGPMAGDSALPGGYVFDVTKGAISGVRAFDPAGNEATIGRVVVVDGFAIYDRIETRPEHRGRGLRSEEHTSELQSLMRISYAVFCLKKKQH